MRDFISPNSVKRHTYGIKNLRLGHDLPISVINRVIQRFHEALIFHESSHIKSFAKIKPSQKFPNLQYAKPTVQFDWTSSMSSCMCLTYLYQMDYIFSFLWIELFINAKLTLVKFSPMWSAEAQL